jgi:hypothetical protein
MAFNTVTITLPLLVFVSILTAHADRQFAPLYKFLWTYRFCDIVPYEV